MSIKSVIKSEPGSQSVEVKTRRILEQKKRRVSTGVIKSLKCNCTRESGYCRRQRDFQEWSRREGMWNNCVYTLQVLEEGSWSGLHLKQTMLKSKEKQRRSWVLAIDKAYHLLFIAQRYLVGILCEENETNTREPVHAFKLQALFFFFYCPPMSS